MNIKKDDPFFKRLIIVIIASICIMGFLGFIGNIRDQSEKIDLVVFAQKVKDHQIKSIIIEGELLKIEDKEGKKYQTVKGNLPFQDIPVITKWASDEGINQLSVVQEKNTSFFMNHILDFLWIIVLGIFLSVWIKKSKGMGLPKIFDSIAKRFSAESQRIVKFSDVAGLEEVKEEVEELVHFLKNPAKFKAVGARIPKGVLFIGSPGTGKTLFAKALAGEAEVAFFPYAGSQFVEMMVGMGASRVRDIFAEARKHPSAIIFIDELDALGKQRGNSGITSNDEKEQTLNQLLTELDGFTERESIIVIGATNRADMLDKALVRPGRFDRQVVFPLPDVRAREAILKIHSSNKPLKNIDLSKIARMTPLGFSGADLENVMNEAVLLAMRRGGEHILVEEIDISQAIKRVLLGPERKNAVISNDEKLRTAYHEGGHAIVGELIANSDPTESISIVPRGFSGGHTQSLPEEERHSFTKEQISARLATLYGGYVAEKLMLGNTSTGAENDIKQITELVKKMVAKWGMGEGIPLIAFETGQDMGFPTQWNCSNLSAEKIDQAIEKIADKELKRATETLTKHRASLDRLAKALVEKETIEREEFLSIIT